MKEIDNIESIRSTLEFNNFGEFYYISIMQRAKDGHKNISSHESCRRIRSFYIFSLKQFDDYTPFIKEICTKLNARAYIEMNRKDIFKCQLECINRLSQCIQHQTTKSRAIMDSVVAGAPSRDKLWLIDVDDTNIGDSEINDIINYVKKRGKYYTAVPTVSGVHIITGRFDTRDWAFKNAEIKRNAFTLLYYNNEE